MMRKIAYLLLSYLNKESTLTLSELKGGKNNHKTSAVIFTNCFSLAQDLLVTWHNFLNGPFLVIEVRRKKLSFPFPCKVQFENCLLKSCSITSYGQCLRLMHTSFSVGCRCCALNTE